MTTREERNKAVVLRLKEEVSTQGRFEVMNEIAVPDFRPRRQAVHNLAQNARDQGFPEPGHQMRKAIPDRVDRIESIVAEGDHVGMRWRVTGTHEGDLFGIPATGKPIDVQSIGWFKVLDGRIAEAWFMADEVDLLRQLGATLPKRNDGKRNVVPTMGEGEDAATMAARIRSKPALDEQDSNRLAALEKRRAPGFRELRRCSQHLRDYARARGIGPLDLDVACPGRTDRIDCVIADGSSVWTHFKMAGTHTGTFLGCPPTGRRVEMTAVRIQTFSGGACTDVWCFGDELGLLQQVDAVHLLLP